MEEAKIKYRPATNGDEMEGGAEQERNAGGGGGGGGGSVLISSSKVGRLDVDVDRLRNRFRRGVSASRDAGGSRRLRAGCFRTWQVRYRYMCACARYQT